MRFEVSKSESEEDTDDPGRFDWAYIRRIALQQKRQLIAAHAIAMVGAVISVPIPLLMPLLVDEVLLGKPAVAVRTIDRLTPAEWHGPVLYITAVLLVTLLLRLISALLNVWQSRQFSLISKDVIYRIRKRLIERLERISMAEYEGLGSGAVTAHLVTDLDTLDTFVGGTLSRSLVALLSLAGTAAVLLWMHWRLALFILLLNPVVIYFPSRFGKHVKQLKKQENAAIGAFQLALTETLDAIHQIRASNREGHYFQHLINTARQVKMNSAAFSWKSDAASRMSFLVFLFGFDAFRALAMFMVFYSDLSIGRMMAVFGYLWFMMSPVQELLGIQYAFFGAKASLERINRLFGLNLEPQYPHRSDPFAGKRTVAISIEDLFFTYPNGSEVLRGISMRIEAGEHVAVVGASGGGKSTLVQVLIGLYPPTRGMIAFDGVAMDQIGMDVVRENVVTVLQHPAIFNDTLRANLTLGRTAPDDALWEALTMAQLRETVASFPSGLDTVLGRFGMRLSGGQRQRIAIARMILSEPKVVILDEATSALDNETEARLYIALQSFLRERTTLIVAHRLSAIRQAERVVVFEDGQVIEQGDHETLIAQEGLYAKLYRDRSHEARHAVFEPGEGLL